MGPRRWSGPPSGTSARYGCGSHRPARAAVSIPGPSPTPRPATGVGTGRSTILGPNALDRAGFASQPADVLSRGSGAPGSLEPLARVRRGNVTRHRCAAPSRERSARCAEAETSTGDRLPATERAAPDPVTRGADDGQGPGMPRPAGPIARRPARHRPKEGSARHGLRRRCGPRYAPPAPRSRCRSGSAGPYGCRSESGRGRRWPASPADAPLDPQRRIDGPRGSCEDGEHLVGTHVHLFATRALDGATEQAADSVQQVGVFVAQAAKQSGRVLDVGQEQGDLPGG